MMTAAAQREREADVTAHFEIVFDGTRDDLGEVAEFFGELMHEGGFEEGRHYEFTFDRPDDRRVRVHTIETLLHALKVMTALDVFVKAEEDV